MHNGNPLLDATICAILIARFDHSSWHLYVNHYLTSMSHMWLSRTWPVQA